MLCSVWEGGRDVSGEGARNGEPDDGNQDLKLDLDGKRKKLFFCLDMLVASKCSVMFSGGVYLGMSVGGTPWESKVTS